MISALRMHQLFQSHQTNTNRSIVNVFNGQKATTKQACDILKFHQIGKQLYETCKILEQPSSSDAKVRHNTLLTLKPTESKCKKKINQKEKETKKVIQCLHRKLAWCKHNSQANYLNSDQQYSLYPGALADEQGRPRKGSKSNWTDKLINRYKSTWLPVFICGCVKLLL